MFNMKISIEDEKLSGVIPVNYTQENEPIYEGLYGSIATGKFDMKIICSFLTTERKKVFDYVHPVYKSSIKAYVKRTSSNLDFKFFMKPFESSAWYVLFLICFGFFFSFIVTWKIFKWNEDDAERTLTFKILVISFWFNFITLLAYYGGAITTDLTILDFKIPFNNLGEVIKSTAES